MINREEYLNYLIKLQDKQIIKIITGIRRCGKSTLLALYRDYLKQNKVSEKQIINLNFEKPSDNIYSNWRDLYNDIVKKLLKNKMNYIFLDEVQIVPEFEKMVNGLLTLDNVDIYNRF